MNSESSAVSSSHLRERDRIIHQKYEDQINALQSKVQKIKHSSNEISKALFDATNRGRRLAEALGFIDVHDAQVAIDSADHALTFRECQDRVQDVESQLYSEKRELEDLRETLRIVQQENKRLIAEKKDLEERYDSINNVKERASERYKLDYKKWREFNRWLFAEDDQHRNSMKRKGITPEEEKRRDLASLMRKREKMIEIGPDLARFDGEAEDWQHSTTPRGPPPIGGIDMDGDKENGGSSFSATNKVPFSIKDPTSTPTPPLLLRNSHRKSVANVVPPSSSPTIFLSGASNAAAKASTRMPLSFRPIADNIMVAEPSAKSCPSPSTTLHIAPPPVPRGNSSDTEDDSQAVWASSIKLPAAALPQNLVERNLVTPHAIPVTPRPNSSNELKINKISDSERPAKLRRLNENADNSAELGMSTRKGKEREKNIFLAPSTIHKKTQDYSAFKGRGRYSRPSDSAQGGINSSYAIDPTQNGGVDYQYDEVVRNREERRRMDAGDCECCREYYQSVGPMPARLQAPLWRSPKRPSKPCPKHAITLADQLRFQDENETSTETPRQAPEVKSHRKAISRHRHAWARASTPPGYWGIGFPDTQEVGHINEKAREMQKRKNDEVAREANEGGRYRKK